VAVRSISRFQPPALDEMHDPHLTSDKNLLPSMQSTRRVRLLSPLLWTSRDPGEPPGQASYRLKSPLVDCVDRGLSSFDKVSAASKSVAFTSPISERSVDFGKTSFHNSSAACKSLLSTIQQAASSTIWQQPSSSTLRWLVKESTFVGRRPLLPLRSISERGISSTYLVGLAPLT
jgi:hypothetical protein